MNWLITINIDFSLFISSKHVWQLKRVEVGGKKTGKIGKTCK